MIRVPNSDDLKGIKIIYEDTDWIIIDKPPGVMSQAGNPRLPNVIDILKTYRRKNAQKNTQENVQTQGEPIFISAVQRLDTPVSGIMVCAKTPTAADYFRRQLIAHQVRKTYVALIPIGETQLAAQSWLDRGVKRGNTLKLYSYFEKFTGPTIACRLTITPLDFGRRFQLVSIDLHTGGYHQIRAQCAARNLPIVGDTKYGSPESRDRVMLHAHRVSFGLTPAASLREFISDIPSAFRVLS